MYSMCVCAMYCVVRVCQCVLLYVCMACLYMLCMYPPPSAVVYVFMECMCCLCIIKMCVTVPNVRCAL